MATGAIRANTIALLAGRVAAALTTFVVAVIAARELGEDFGQFGAIVGAGFVANTLVTFGTDTLIVRAVSRDPRGSGGDLAAPSLALQLGLGMFFTLVAGLAYLLGIASGAVLIQAALLAPQAVITVAGSVLRGRQHMVQMVTGNAVGGVVSVIASLALFASRTGVWVPILALGVGQVVTAMINGRQAQLKLRIPASTHEIRSLIRVTSAFAVMVIATTVSGQITMIVLGGFGVAGAAGFAGAMRFLEAARLLPASAYGAAFPAMADRVHRRPAYADWSRRLLYYAAAVTVILIVFAGPLSSAAFGELIQGPRLLQILALGIVPIVLRLRLSFELIADGKEGQVARAAVATAVFIVVGSLLALSIGLASDDSASGAVAQVTAAVHTAGTVLNVVVLDQFNRRSKSSNAETAARVGRHR